MMPPPRYGLDELRQSMVQILRPNPRQPDIFETVGSGFIIRADGYLVTCHHVIYQLDELKVQYQGQRYTAQWCQDLSNPDVDIAVLKIPIEDGKPVPIINPRVLQTAVIVYGFAHDQERHFPEGYPAPAEHIHPHAPLATLETYSRYSHDPRFHHSWNVLPQAKATFLSHRIDAEVSPGTSGGPVLAEALGGVVGVIQCSGPGESYVIRWNMSHGNDSPENGPLGPLAKNPAHR